jgi:chloramphenicol O-acetyltransferase
MMKPNTPLSNVESKTGEYIPVYEVNPPPPPKPRPKRGCLFRLFSSVLWMFIIIVLVFFGLMFGRQWYDSLLAHIDYNKAVHSDESVVKTGIYSQVRPTVTLVYKNQNGKQVRVIADAQDYSDFVNQQTAHLDQSKTQLLTKTDKALHDALTKVFDDVHQRVDRFADWYFAYTTTYKILWEATTSATRHTLSAEATTISEAVSYDIEKYLHKHYENIVLRPEVTDPQLQTAYRTILQAAHKNYVDVLSKMQTDFQAFVSKYTTHLETPSTENTVLNLDWDSQFNKINMAEYEKGPKGAAMGAALAAGGAATGKVVAGAVGKGVAETAVAGAASQGMAAKAVAGAASKGIFAKFSAPFVSKAVLAGTGGAVGALGGPLGTVIGALGGLGVDYALNEGMELTQRETFINDVNQAVIATQKEWEKQMLQTLHQAINIWMDDTIQLLPRYQ